MIISKKYSGKKVGVVGLGKTGIAATQSILLGGGSVFAWDDNLKDYDSLKASILEGLNISNQHNLLDHINSNIVLNPDISSLSMLSAVLVSPGIGIQKPKLHPISEKAIELGIPLISDFDLLFKESPKASYIGVTGTNGKSTTTALIGHIFSNMSAKTEIGGNIGTSVLALDKLDEYEFYILEASSFQIERLHDISFNTAILLNITPDHLDRYTGFQAYLNTKADIFKRQSEDDIAIICIDCPNAKIVYEKVSSSSNAIMIPISCEKILDEGISLVQGVIYVNIESLNEQFNLGFPHYLPGAHNAQNILAAFSAAFLNGFNPEEILKHIHTFKGLDHRMKLICEHGDLKFVNDSKATNSDACEKALKTYDDIYWIAGGISKDSGIEQLSGLFYKIKHAFLVGTAANQFSSVLKKYNIPHTVSETLSNAMTSLKTISPKRGVVLLSPACSSLDQWKNFEERGAAFSQYAKNWPNY